MTDATVPPRPSPAPGRSGPPLVVLVTGASSGVGAQTVRRLLDLGHTVHAAARRTERMADLERLGAHVRPLDLADAASIEACMADVLRESGRLDVLVNVAGYGSYGAVENVPVDEARRQFEVNLFGLAHLTSLALPGMRERRSGRIVNVSSVAGSSWEPMAAWYHASKAALDRWSDCLRVEVAPFGIRVVTVRPSGIHTDWSSIAVDALRRTSAGTPYARQANGVAHFIGTFTSSPLTSGPVAPVADDLVEAATAARPRRIVPTSRGSRATMLLASALPTAVTDAVVRRSVQVLSHLPARRG